MKSKSLRFTRAAIISQPQPETRFRRYASLLLLLMIAMFTAVLAIDGC